MWMTSQQPVLVDGLNKQRETDSAMATRRFDRALQADDGLGWGWMQVRCDDVAAHNAVAQHLLLTPHAVDRIQPRLGDASSNADPSIDEAQARPTAGRSVVGAILRYLDPLAETH